MSLRYPVQIRRRAPGTYVGGRWVPGVIGAPESILATVQPAQLADYDMLQRLPEGGRIEAIVRVYTTAQIALMSEEAGVSGDLLDWPDGMRIRPYVFIARSPWQSRIISHYRYLAALLVEPTGS